MAKRERLIIFSGEKSPGVSSSSPLLLRVLMHIAAYNKALISDEAVCQGKLYCGKHFGELMNIPQCAGCVDLILDQVSTEGSLHLITFWTNWFLQSKIKLRPYFGPFSGLFLT